MRVFLFCFFAWMICSCSDSRKPPVVGGPCSYNTSAFAYKIVKIEPDTSQTYPAYLPDSLKEWKLLLTDTVMRRDSFYLHRITRQTITPSLIKKYDLHPGRLIEGEVQRITSGTCTPEVYKFKDEFLN